MSDHLNPKTRPASEEPIDLATLDKLKDARHFGWKWHGVELGLAGCLCHYAPCQLIDRVASHCPHHNVNQLGTAKQVHWARECPAM